MSVVSWHKSGVIFDAKLDGLDDVIEALQKGQEDIIQAASAGLKKAALHLVARAKELAPIDTGNLEANIHSENKVERTANSLSIEVGVAATSGEGADVTDYALRTHENMQYTGPNVGGSRTQGRGEDTIGKGVSKVEPSDGTAGGKYLERPCENKPEQYTEIIREEIDKALESGEAESAPGA